MNQHERELYEERAAIKEYCANVPREQAEREAIRELVELVADSQSAISGWEKAFGRVYPNGRIS